MTEDTKTTLRGMLDRPLEAFDAPDLGRLVRGKVRDSFVLGDDRRLVQQIESQGSAGAFVGVDTSARL